MVSKVYIKDNTKGALSYIHELPQFKNGTEFVFKPGVNIIVGENGSGKSTLMNLIKRYLLVGYQECCRGDFNCNLTDLKAWNDKFTDGVEVFADYDKNTFRFSQPGERGGDEMMKDFNSFGQLYTEMHSSTGEGVKLSLYKLFEMMFSKNAKLKFDYETECKNFPQYIDYIKEHRIENPENEWTILLDEPDRNLSIQNIKDIAQIFEYRKKNTQIIGVLHNPLLIYKLSKLKNINWIEMTPGYIETVKNYVNSMIK